MSVNLEEIKRDCIANLNQYVDMRALERTNADLLIKLINNADTPNEVISIAQLGTGYKRTGLHYDKRLEKFDDGNTIKYLKKNKELSFYDESNPVPHKLIIGDNYDALLNLLIEYKGRIDVIYIDPPYGKDSMGEFAQTNYENAITRDNLLSMLYPRFLLAKKLLSPQGAIFCSIDDRNHSYLKCLFDEIFNEKNFLGNFVWRKKAGGGQDDDYFVTEHEYILAYKNGNDFEWIDYSEDLSEDSFKYEDEKGKYSLTKLEKWGSSAHKEDRPTMHYPIKNPDGEDCFPIAPDGTPGRWRVGKDRLEKLINNDGVYWKKDGNNRWIPYEKTYYDKNKKKYYKARSIIDIAESGDGTKLLTSILMKNNLFKNCKPIEIIKFLLEHVKNDIVLDFFAGSGTTGHAVLELNKEKENPSQFILCNNNEITGTTPNGISYDVTSKRLKRIMTGDCYQHEEFDWIKKNGAYGGSLEVCEIEKVANFETTEGKTPFDVIDETLYGKAKFNKLKDKIDWVCKNFEVTQSYLKEKGEDDVTRD